MYEVINNMLYTIHMDNIHLDSHDPFGEIISLIRWAICSIYYTTLQVSPRQLAFERDILFDMDFIAN